MRSETEHKDAVASIRRLYVPQIMQNEAAAREYALLALRSLITLNAGVAVAYPTISELFFDNAKFEQIFWPTLLSILGAVLSVIATYLAYHNYSFMHHSKYCEMELEIIKADEFYDTQTYYTFQEYRSRTKEFWDELNNAYKRKTEITYKLSNIMGLLSGVSFIFSIVFFCFGIYDVKLI